MDDLTFLETYWSRVKNIANKIEKELPVLLVNHEKIGEKLHIVQYKDLTDWSVKPNEKSASLTALADKISYMIHLGRSKDIKPMILKIASGRIKKLTKPLGKEDKIRRKRMINDVGFSTYHADFLGHGHFRWNHRAYILTENELKKIREYFEI